jgi:hypothetical protein
VPRRSRGVREIEEGDIVRVIRVRDPLLPEARFFGRVGIVTAIAHGVAHVRFAGRSDARFARHELARIA